MLLDSAKVLFSLNSEFCPNKCYGFVKKSFFELFNNTSDWSFSLNCKIGQSHKNHITLLSLEGVDFAFDFSTNFSFLLRCRDGEEQKSQTITSSVVENLKQQIDQFHIMTINYDFNSNSYYLYFNDELILQKSLTNRNYDQVKKIKLCGIGRQFISSGHLTIEDEYGIEFKNILFAERILTYSELAKYFNSDSTSFIIDEYGRTLLRGDQKKGILAYYNFNDNLYGKIWDLTDNNNFFFTSLPMKQRINNSVI